MTSKAVMMLNKVREKGIVWCLGEVSGRVDRWFRRLLHFLLRWISWVFPFIRFLLCSTSQSEKRILAIWDFRTVPYSIGDLLLLHERCQVLRLIHKVDKVDICFICDPSQPVRKKGEQGVTPDNFHYHFPSLVSTVYLNPHIGSFFIFDSHENLEKFVIDNIDRYYVWPGIRDYAARYKVYNRDTIAFIHNFYQKNGFIPYLDYRESTLEWAYAFYEKMVYPDYPVVVHLRNNPQSGGHRNAVLDAWLEFFKACKGKFSIKFVIIGAEGEIDERFRHLPNVLIAKDYKTSVEKDLVLAYSSLIFLGSPSGPATLVLFSRTPYIVFNFSDRGYKGMPYMGNYSFSTDLQKLVWVPETANILMEEFNGLYHKVDKSDWKEKMEGFMASRGKNTFRSNLKWEE